MNPSIPVHWTRSVLLGACFGVSCAVAQVSPPSAANTPAAFPTLVKIKTPYQAEVERLERERNQALAKTLAGYTADLDRMLKDTTSAADLDGALAAKAERERLAKNPETFAETNDPAPPRILALRGKYAQIRKPILEATKARIDALNKQYLASLDQLQARLAAFSMGKDVAEIKAERERVLKLTGVTVSTTVPAAAPTGSAPTWVARTPALSLQAAKELLTLREDWPIDGDAITGQCDGTQPHKSNPGKSHGLTPSKELHFSLSMSAKSYQSIVVWVDDARCQYSRGHWGNKETMVRLYDKEQHLPGKVENPDGWNTLAAVVKDGKIQFYYDGQLEFEGPLHPPRDDDYVFKVGFTSFKNTVRVKNVSCDLQPEREK